MFAGKTDIIIIKLTIPKTHWRIIYQIIKYLSNGHQGSMVVVYFSFSKFRQCTV